MGTVTFGEVKGAAAPLLQRVDTVSCTIHKQQAPSTDDAVPSAMQVQHACTCSSCVPQLYPQSVSSRLLSNRSTSKLHESHSSASLGPVVATGSGNWLAYLDWEGVRYWTMAEDNAETWRPASDPLPSDVRFREDLQELQGGNVVRAQEAKEWMENVQRRDKKLRMEAGGGKH